MAYFENFIEHSNGRRRSVYVGTLTGRFFDDYAIRALYNGDYFTARRVNDDVGLGLEIVCGGFMKCARRFSICNGHDMTDFSIQRE